MNGIMKPQIWNLNDRIIYIVKANKQNVVSLLHYDIQISLKFDSVKFDDSIIMDGNAMNLIHAEALVLQFSQWSILWGYNAIILLRECSSTKEHQFRNKML